jgi:hypothetical protein
VDGPVEVVCLDLGYKLNGRPDPSVDSRYSVHERTRWQDRLHLLVDGVTGCVSVVAKNGVLLCKGEDQVVSGRRRFQSHVLAAHAATLGLSLEDVFGVDSLRKQPNDDREQHHGDMNVSLLLVFQPSQGRTPGNFERPTAIHAGDLFPIPKRWRHVASTVELLLELVDRPPESGTWLHLPR